MTSPGPEALRNARRPVHPAQLRAPLKKPGDVTGSTPTRSGCSRTDCLRSQGTEAILSGNGDGQRPKRAHQALPKPDAVALSLITAGQTGTRRLKIRRTVPAVSWPRRDAISLG